MIELIQKIDFFSGLDEKLLKKLAEACIMRQFTKNETIVRQGEMGLGLYVIAKGRVKVEREQGGQRLLLNELGPEQFFGEMALLDNKPRSATVTGLEDSECVLLTRDSFVRLMNKYPEIPIRMARVLAERLRVANEKLAAAPAAAQGQSRPATANVATQATPSPGASAPAGNASTPQAAPATATASAVATANPEAPANGTKAKIHKTVLDTFQSLYTVKAFSRFSVAVLGCPVEAAAANAIEQFRIGDVKAVLLPAFEACDLRITASEPGWFTLHVFTPEADRPLCFGPVEVTPDDDVHLLLDAPAMTLRSGGREIAPV